MVVCFTNNCVSTYLRLDITMTNPQGMDMTQRPRKLIEIKLDIKQGKGDFGFLMMTRNGVDCFGDVF
jgi:hypothetical protein